MALAFARMLCIGAALCGATSCNSALVHGLATAFEDAPDPAPWNYLPLADYSFSPPPGSELSLLDIYAPAFVIEEGEAEWNRIGTPTLARGVWCERARVDPARPALYAEARTERVGSQEVYELLYRVHFEQFAPSWTTLFSLHRNAGLLVIVTLDRATLVPLLVSTVHTCGCWLAVQPTAALAPEALPADWPAQELVLAGEHLAARLPVPGKGQRLVVFLRSRSHRVHDVRVGEPGLASPLVLPLRDMRELRRLAIAGTDGETGSFFYERGYLRGYVRGAWAPLEGLTLGLLTFDPRLGMDRDFGDPAETGARFFTALAPWKRESSRLDRFGCALGELGFRLDAFGPE